MMRVTAIGYEYVDNNRPLELRIRYDLLKSVRNLHLGFDIFSSDGAHLFRTYDMNAANDTLRPPGLRVSLLLPGGSLRTGFIISSWSSVCIATDSSAGARFASS
ncbi:MAG: hypothetical protein R3C44_11995 [Chloroflexota bacterium]